MMLLNFAFEGSFISNDCKKALCSFSIEFLQQCHVCWSKEFVQDLLLRHLKNVKNNHNTLLVAPTFSFTSIIFKLTLS